MNYRDTGNASTDTWLPAIYDLKLGFNAHYGRDLLEMLAPRDGEMILDLGCGTGHLTQQIAERGATVVGLDRSASMIERARERYPGLTFVVADGQNFVFPADTFDAIFTNAALHWMKDATAVVRCAWNVLKPGGRFVAEFGGKGNVDALVEASRAVRALMGFAVDHFEPWYFPSLGDYAALLERQGFRVVYASHFDRPTPLDDGERGIWNWLTVFGSRLFGDIPERQRAEFVAKVEDRLRPVLYQEGHWTADYVRLRIVAVKATKV